MNCKNKMHDATENNDETKTSNVLEAYPMISCVMEQFKKEMREKS